MFYICWDFFRNFLPKTWLVYDNRIRRNFGKEQDAFSANPFLRMPFLPFRAALFENAFCYTQLFPYECKEKTL